MGNEKLDMAGLMDEVRKERSHLDYQLSEVRWNQRSFGLGFGVDAVTGEIAKQAIEPVQVKGELTRDVEFTYHMVRSQSEMQSLIDASTKGKYNIKSVTISESTQFLEEVSYSETQHTVVARLVVGSPAMIPIPHDSYRLTPDARTLLQEQPERFRDVYGDYFISSYSWRGEFLVVYKFRSYDSIKLRDLTTSLDVTVEGMFSKEGTVKLRKKAEEHGVEVSINLHMSGLGPVAPGDERPAAGGLPDIAESLAWFAKHVVGKPEMAQLTHYKLFDNRYPSSISIATDDFVDLKGLYEKLWLIRARFHGMPAFYQRNFRERFNRLDAEVTSKKTLLPGRKDKVAELDQEARDLLHELQLAQDNWLKGDKSCKQQTSWLYGMSSDERTEAVTIYTEEKHFQEGFKHPVWSQRRGSVDFGDGSKQLIVGVEVRSNWKDGTNGIWWTSQPHFVLEHNATVHFKSEPGRGCNWSVKFHYVDADLYRF
ncbi:hypothetical protein KCV01_g12519, partial [Aureobasidium melanogenum]